MPSALEVYTAALSGRNRLLSFGCNILDKCTGKLRTQGVTELSGEAGSGKSQICMTLAIQCYLPESMGGLSGATAYMSCAEGEFPIRRLQQIASGFEARTSISSSEFLSNIHIEKCYSSDDINETLFKRIPDMCLRKNVRLLIIDSLAGVMRTDFDALKHKDMMLRVGMLFKLATQLKWLSDTYKIAIVVVNQVTAAGVGGHSDANLGDDSIPALGLSWSHCVNTRIRLYRDTRAMRTASNQWGVRAEADDNLRPLFLTGRDDSINSTESAIDDSALNPNHNAIQHEVAVSQRILWLEFSPCQPSRHCRFQIVESGVKGLV